MNKIFIISLSNGATFNAEPDETILAAAQRAQWLIRYGCRNGNCAVCEATLLSGAVSARNGDIIVADRASKDGATKVLLCQCRAAADILLDLGFDPRSGSADQARRFYAQLLSITTTDGDVHLEFNLPAGRKPLVNPGQLAQVSVDSDTLQFAIESEVSSVRKLVLNGFADGRLVVGNYYHVRYPLGIGLAV